MVPSTACPSLCYKVTDDMFSSIVEDQIICQSVLEIKIATVDERPAHPPLLTMANATTARWHNFPV